MLLRSILAGGLAKSYCDLIATALGVGLVRIKVAVATIITASETITYKFSLISRENPTDRAMKLTETILACREIAL